MIVPSENMHLCYMYVHVLAWGLYSLMLFATTRLLKYQVCPIQSNYAHPHRIMLCFITSAVLVLPNNN